MLKHRGIFLHIECRIHGVDILLVELLAQQFYRFTKTLEMHHFAFTQETDHIIDIRIIRKPQDVIVGDACLLLCQGVP